MMPEAYALWEQLEKDIRQNLFVNSGLLVVSDKRLDYLKDVQTCHDKSDYFYDKLSAEDIRQRYPGMRFDDRYSGLYEPSAGVLKTDKCLHAFQSEFIKFGGTVHDQEPVLEIKPGIPVQIKTCKNNYTCKSVILAAGSWINKLLQNTGLQLPLETHRVHVLYWKHKRERTQFPAIILRCVNGKKVDNVYGLPDDNYPGYFKLCLHRGHHGDPDNWENFYNEKEIKAATGIVKEYFPSLHDQVAINQTCMLTFTPDRDFILDFHPAHKNVIIAAGFSGNGFKLAPVVGKILCEMSTHRTLSYSLQPFKIQRFNKSKM